jgi:hypothetical protein
MDLQLDLPAIDTPSGFGGMSFGGATSAGGGSIGPATHAGRYEESPFIDDAEFAITADGELVEVERGEGEKQPSKGGSVVGEGKALSESGFSARVRAEHEAGAAGFEVNFVLNAMVSS